VGRAHAALVYDGERCVGWCQFGSPDELPRIKHRKAYLAGAEAPPDWRITCFFVDREHRGAGVAGAALAGALEAIGRLGGGPRSCTTARSRCSSAMGSSAPAGSGSGTGSSRRM